MQMIYDSDAYVVLQMNVPTVPTPLGPPLPKPLQLAKAAKGEPEWAPSLIREGFEIVDKRMGREVYLDGSWAEHFKRQIDAWQEKSPTHDEIEFVLDGYTQLASHPVRVH